MSTAKKATPQTVAKTSPQTPSEKLIKDTRRITTSTFYAWNKEFIEAGKRQLAGDTLRQATSDEVNALRKENQALKENLADLVVRYDIVKKSLKMLEEL